MALENAKKLLTLMWEDKALRDRLANRNEEEVMAVAKEMGLEFTAEELKEAAKTHELTLGEMETAAGGFNTSGSYGDITVDSCPKNGYKNHSWKYTCHREDEWFNWLKDGELFSIGYDRYTCEYCGRTKDV